MPMSELRMLEPERSRCLRWQLCATVALSVIVLATTACGCNASRNFSVDPRTATLRVGQSVTLRAADVSPCRDKSKPQTWFWSTADSAVVRVDAASGRTTGLTAGTANVKGFVDFKVGTTETDFGNVTVTVTVVP